MKATFLIAVLAGFPLAATGPAAAAKRQAHQPHLTTQAGLQNPFRPPAIARPAAAESDLVYVDDADGDDFATTGWTDDGPTADATADVGSFDDYESVDWNEGYATECLPRWAHRGGFFAEFLYLRARDAEVTYAAGVDGPTTPPGNPANPGNQLGPLGVVDPDYEPAYRVGFTRALSDFSSIRASYTRFESSTADSISTGPSPFVQSQVTHPGVLNAADNWQQGGATLDIDFELVDIEYRWLYSYSDTHAINLLAGLRYGQLAQDFQADFAVSGTRAVDTRVTFEGGGIRLGIEAERFVPCTGWLFYGRGTASFLGGDVRSSFVQSSSFATTEIDTSWKAGRVVTILDLELGLGWTSHSGRLQLNAGYLFSTWLNATATDEWIDSVNANSFAGVGESGLTFDGWTARAEYRF